MHKFIGINFFFSGDINVQCSYYNYNVNVWEPIIEPSIKTENIYRPWEISIKVFAII